jgi:hypothetical protein
MRFVACATKSPSRFLTAEAVRNDKLKIQALPGCGKQVEILCQQRVDSDRRKRVVCTSFEDRQICVIATRSREGKFALN